MESNIEKDSLVNLRMDSVEFYEKQAADYHSSEDYSQMIKRYPILKNTIESCSKEELIN